MSGSVGKGGTTKVEHSATVDKGLKMKIKRTKPGTKTSEAKHEIVKSEPVPQSPIKTEISVENGMDRSLSASEGGGSDSGCRGKHQSGKRGLGGSGHSRSRDKIRVEKSGEMNGVVASSNSSSTVTSDQGDSPTTSCASAESVQLSRRSAGSSGSEKERVVEDVIRTEGVPRPFTAICSVPSSTLVSVPSAVCIKPDPDQCCVTSKPEVTNAGIPPCKKIKTEPQDKVTQDVCIGTSIGTITEPDCLGPCEPGTSVNLEGIVWHETQGGVLVVNVTWRGKTYVGTLLDCTKHDWAPPRFCESPTSDLDARTPKGRGKRGRGGAAGPAVEVKTITETRAVAQSKLRNMGKGRRGVTGNIIAPGSSPSFVAPSSPAHSDSGGSSSKKKNRTPETDFSSVDEARNGKRNRSVSRGPPSSSPASPPPSPILLECPEPHCSKKYKHINGLRYHQSHAHGAACTGSGSSSTSASNALVQDDDSKDMFASENEESYQESASISPTPDKASGNTVVDQKDEMSQDNIPPVECNESGSRPPTPVVDSSPSTDGVLRFGQNQTTPSAPSTSSLLTPPDSSVTSCNHPTAPSPAPTPVPPEINQQTLPQQPQLSPVHPVEITLPVSTPLYTNLGPNTLLPNEETQPPPDVAVQVSASVTPTIESPIQTSLAISAETNPPVIQCCAKTPIKASTADQIVPTSPVDSSRKDKLKHHKKKSKDKESKSQIQLPDIPLADKGPSLSEVELPVDPERSDSPLPNSLSSTPLCLPIGGREEVQSPAYSDISDANDAEDKGQGKLEKKADATVPPHSLSHFSMYPFYSQSPYIVQRPPSPGTDNHSELAVQKGPDACDTVDTVGVDLGKKDSKEEDISKGDADYQSKLIQHPYYPYGYVPGYPYNVDANYHVHVMAEEQERFYKGQLEQKKSKDKEDLKEDVRKFPSTMKEPSSGPGPPNVVESTTLKEKQNENRQILKESIDMKTHMCAGKPKFPNYDSSYLIQRQQEDLRRFYLYPEQQQQQPQQPPPPSQQQQQPPQQQPPKSAESLTPKKDIPSGTPGNNRMDSHCSPSETKMDSPSTVLLVPAASSHTSPKPLLSPANSQREHHREHERKSSENKADKKDASLEKTIKTESGVKPTMETQGPPPPTSSYAYIHSNYMQTSPHYGSLPFDPGHPMYRTLNPMLVPGPYTAASVNPYLHPGPMRYHVPAAAPEDLSRPTGPTKALDLLQHHANQYYTSHKIHELQERAIKSPSGPPPPAGPSISPAAPGGPTKIVENAPPKETLGSTPNSRSRSPPPQRHVHTHHHTHVGLGYPILPGQYPAPYGAAVLATQQVAAVAASVISPYSPK